MKRLLACLSFLATANVFAAGTTSEPRLFGRPACIGTEVLPEIMGTYLGKSGGVSMLLTLGEGSVTYIQGDNPPENSKAWTCRKNGVLVLVVMKGSDRYMSRLILQGGKYLIDLGDVLPGHELGQAELKRLSLGEGITVFKKQQTKEIIL